MYGAEPYATLPYAALDLPELVEPPSVYRNQWTAPARSTEWQAATRGTDWHAPARSTEWNARKH